MSNRIKSLSLYDHRLDPTEAEIWIRVEPEDVTASTEVHGRLVGPRCAYSTTVEVAYPMRELIKRYASTDIPSITVRVVIPEPSLWEPVSPFVYEGPLELWQKGTCVERIEIRHALQTVRLGSRGLRLNDKPLTLHGISCGEVSREKAANLRQSRCNALLTSLTGEFERLWKAADELGFLRLGRITSVREIPKTSDLRSRNRYASELGWLVSEEILKHEVVQAIGLRFLGHEDRIVGAELTGAPTAALPEGTSFLACEEELLPSVAGLGLPILLLSGKPLPQEPKALQSKAPLILGTIYDVSGRD